MRKTIYFLAVLALTGTVTAGIGEAWAYFTTYTEAEGGYTVRMGNRTDITEDFSSRTKKLTVVNNGQEPVYIRAKAFCDSPYKLTYSGTGWREGEEGYYYYENIVESGGTAQTLNIRIDHIPEKAAEDDAFNVIVIYESTPVRYDKDGKPYADWSVVLDTGETEGGKG